MLSKADFKIQITQKLLQKLCFCGSFVVLDFLIVIDGLEETHDEFRQTKGGFQRAVEGVRNLLEQDFHHVQVTTVVTKKNLSQLEELFQLMDTLDVNSWRVINIEPIGRALRLKDYILEPKEYQKLLKFIRDKRKDGYPVTYGCSHYLGPEYECEVRDWYYLCNAGIYTASIMANGDIGACLDIERRSETIQGNILHDDFTKIWQIGFRIFRNSLAEKNETCFACDSRYFCDGGPYHSWNYNKNEPMICFKNILF